MGKAAVSIRVYSEKDRLCLADDGDVTFKYGQLEVAIASLHNVPAKALGTFKSRLKHFQRIGLVPASPGKGQKIAYRVGDAITWALCFELAELGLPPEQIRMLIRAHGQALYYSFQGPLPDEDQILVIEGNFLGWHLNAEGEEPTGEGKTSFGTIPISQVAEWVFQTAKLPRVLLLNVTHLKRELGNALGIEWR